MPLASRQSSFLSYLIMALGVLGGFLYYNQTDFSQNVPSIEQRHQMASMKGLENVKVDYRILKNDAFQELRIFGQMPVNAQASGKSNPFQ
jgi:hypothetical protein